MGLCARVRWWVLGCGVSFADLGDGERWALFF